MRSRSLRSIAGIGAIAAVALPSAALAQGGTPAPAPAPDVACATIAATNSGLIDQLGSKKPITLGFKLTNCSATRTLTLATSLMGTATTVRSIDPSVIDVCAGVPFSAANVTLKARSATSISVSPVYPFCGRPQWGINGYDIDYAVTLRNSADGALLATTTSSVLRRGGV
ncbi:MAG: hypothetical protein QOE11_2518 [Solirubrobacteraceae bacterium]|jgi:hypothetical protein|nr:hypothetical protein [Solirubrobacteraceae bacterium]